MKIKKRPCKSCRTCFAPDKYNHQKQEYCYKPDCRKVAARGKRAKYWRKKKWDLEFRANEVNRVQKWRLKNPEYGQNKSETNPVRPSPSESRNAAIDSTQTPQDVNTLRDLVKRQEFIIVGMVSQLVGGISENIESFILKCCDKGEEFTEFSDSANTRLFSSKILCDGKSEKKIEKMSS